MIEPTLNLEFTCEMYRIVISFKITVLRYIIKTAISKANLTFFLNHTRLVQSKGELCEPQPIVHQHSVCMHGLLLLSAIYCDCNCTLFVFTLE